MKPIYIVFVYCRDNSKLCSCWGDRQMFYWDVSIVLVIQKFRGHESEIFVSAGYDRSLRAWDCGSHGTEPIQVVLLICFWIAEFGRSDCWKCRFEHLTFALVGREILDDLASVNCISMSSNGNCVLASCLDSTLRLLDRSRGELLQEYKRHTCKSYKMDCCLTNSDAHVTGGSEDGFIYFWDFVAASVVSRFRAHSSVVSWLLTYGVCGSSS
ncbi:WD40 repeat [Dillenia turbinata]|uniref:WD40 repeat n=1 Tax=Dillenia turbinata TaxID=194707 RepID=A0AAN8V3C8_9MAGN